MDIAHQVDLRTGEIFVRCLRCRTKRVIGHSTFRSREVVTRNGQVVSDKRFGFPIGYKNKKPKVLSEEEMREWQEIRKELNGIS